MIIFLVLLCFVVISHRTILSICFRITLLTQGQSYDCPSACEATLGHIGTWIAWIYWERIIYHNKTRQNTTVCIFYGTNYISKWSLWRGILYSLTSGLIEGVRPIDHKKHRADSGHAPSRWETSLQSNAVSHWLCANLESALKTVYIVAQYTP